MRSINATFILLAMALAANAAPATSDNAGVMARSELSRRIGTGHHGGGGTTHTNTHTTHDTGAGTSGPAGGSGGSGSASAGGTGGTQSGSSQTTTGGTGTTVGGGENTTPPPPPGGDHSGPNNGVVSSTGSGGGNADSSTNNDGGGGSGTDWWNKAQDVVNIASGATGAYVNGVWIASQLAGEPSSSSAAPAPVATSQPQGYGQQQQPPPPGRRSFEDELAQYLTRRAGGKVRPNGGQGQNQGNGNGNGLGQYAVDGSEILGNGVGIWADGLQIASMMNDQPASTPVIPPAPTGAPPAPPPPSRRSFEDEFARYLARRGKKIGGGGSNQGSGTHWLQNVAQGTDMVDGGLNFGVNAMNIYSMFNGASTPAAAAAPTAPAVGAPPY